MRSIGFGIIVIGVLVFVVSIGGYIQARAGKSFTEPLAWNRLDASARDAAKGAQQRRLAAWRSRLGLAVVISVIVIGLGAVLAARA